MRRFYLITFLTFSTFFVSAQEKKFDLGFYIESTKRINRLETTGSNFSDIDAQNNVGFGLGSNLYYLANEILKGRLTVGINFEKETLKYHSPTGTDTKISEVSSITSGIHAIIKTNKKIPLNIVAGFTPYYGLKGNKSIRRDMEFRKFDITGDFGLSYVINLKMLKIMPELRYSKSFIDASLDNSTFGESINSYHRNKLNISIYFFTF